MANSYIDFACVQQKLERTDEKPVASGASVLVARFDLCQKWDGLTVWARFKHGAAVYDVPVIDGCAQIPWEVVNYTGFSVSIWGEKEGGGRLTSAKVFVDVKRSIEPEGVSPLPSTPSQVDMFIAKASAAEAAAGNAAQSAKAAADAASVAPESAAAAQAAAAVAEASAAEAAASKATATAKANAAEASATNAASSESGALAAKIDAEEAADAAATSATKAANSATAAAKSAKEAREAAASAGSGSGGTTVVSPFDFLIVEDTGLDSFSIYDAEQCRNITLMADGGASLSSEPYDDDEDGANDSVRIRISAPTGGGSGEAGEAGADGEDGATFTPSVSADGVISWTNDKGLSNPEPVNIKGAKGDKGDTGSAGAAGKDGVSATHSWNGTTLTVTSASGTSSANLKGDKGDTGAAGVNGKDGEDYVLTSADKTEIAEMVDGATVVQAPKYVNSVEEMTDTERVYVLASTGEIWAYMDTTIEQLVTVTDEIKGTSGNPYQTGRLSSSGALSNDVDTHTLTPYIDVAKAEYQGKRITIHLDGNKYANATNETYVMAGTYDANKTAVVGRAYVSQASDGILADFNGSGQDMALNIVDSTHAKLSFTVPLKNDAGKSINFMRFCGAGTVTDTVYVTYEAMQATTGGQWVNTGTTYAPSLTDEDMQSIVNEVASMVDDQLLAVIGDGAVTV